MKRIAIIPARGGSKRIPLKNIREFHSIPILARVVHTVIEAEVVDDIVVSTDHEAIREIAVAAGAQVPFLRSASTSDDHATLHQVIVEVLESGTFGVVDTVLCVLPTAVLLESTTLRKAATRFAEGDFDSLISVQRYRHPIQRALRVNQAGFLASDPASRSLRTQDASPAFHDAGQFYFARVAELRNRTTLMGSRCAPFELSELEGRDIDVPEDWVVAEALFTARESLRRG